MHQNSAKNAPSVPKVALIGCGNFARQQHARILRRTDSAEFVACCDLDPELATEAAAGDARIRVTSDAQSILEDAAVDAVVIAVSEAVQAEIATAAIEVGKHVYLEKPGGTSETDFDHLRSAVNGTDLSLVFGYNKRFSPAYQEIHRLIQGNGPPRNLSLSMVDDAWRWSKRSHGDSLWMHDGGHFVDLACWLLQKRPNRVYATEGRKGMEYQVILSFPERSEAVLRINGMATMDYPKERAELIMSPGVIQMDDHVELRTFGLAGNREHVTFPGLAQSPEACKWVDLLGDRGLEGMREVRKELYQLYNETGSVSIPPNFIRNQGWQRSLETFFQRVRYGIDSDHASVDDAAYYMKVVSAAAQSMKTGQAIGL